MPEIAPRGFNAASQSIAISLRRIRAVSAIATDLLWTMAGGDDDAVVEVSGDLRWEVNVIENH